MVIFSICLLLFIGGMSIGIVMPIFAPLFTQYSAEVFGVHLSEMAQSYLYTLIISLPLLFMFLGSPIFGTMSDYLGRKKVLLIGLAGITISFVLTITSLEWGSITLLFVSRALAGFMDGTEAIGQATMADISKPEDRARNMSLITFSASLGFIVGPIIGGIFSDPSVVSWFNYKTPFFIVIGLTAFNWLMIKLLFRETFTSSRRKESARKSFNKIFTACLDKRIRIFAITFIVMEICWACYFQSTTLILSEFYHYTSAQIGYFLSYLGAVFCFTMIIMINVFLRFLKHRTIVQLGLIAIATSLAMLTLLPGDIVVLWISVIPFTIGVAMTYNVLLSMFSNAVTPEEQGWIMGGNMALVAGGWLLASLIVGGFHNYLHTLFGILGVLAMAGLWLFSSKAPR